MRFHPAALAFAIPFLVASVALAAPWPAPRARVSANAWLPLAPAGAARDATASEAGARCGTTIDAVADMLAADAQRTDASVLPTPNSLDVDGIAVLEDDGTFFFTNTQSQPVMDIAAVCRAFYRTHGDDYDQLAAYMASGMSQWLGSPTALAAAWLLRNDTQGLGLSLYDAGASCGSPSRLAQFLTMNTLSKYLPDPDQSLYGPDDPLSTMDALEHEFAHRWLAYTFVDSAGAAVPSLLGRDWQHWSFFFDSDSSVMEGCDWITVDHDAERGDSLRTDGAYATLGLLDQYLMGLRARSEVDSFFTVGAPTAFDPPGDYAPRHYPQPDVGCRGHRNVWTLDDLERANGPRVPDAASSPHHWRVAFVLVVPRGTAATTADLAQLADIRDRFPAKLAGDTQGRASVDVSLDSRAGSVRIAHAPLADTEDGAPRLVSAKVTIEGGGLPLHVDPASVRVHVASGTATTFAEMPLAPVAPDSFAVMLPALPPGEVRYWLSAASDSAGIDAVLPASGATAPFTFTIGPDATPPVIAHVPVPRQGWERLPQTLLARVTDNVGVDSVWCESSLDGGPILRTNAVRAGADSFTVSVGAGLSLGHALAYRFVARDASSAGHLAVSNAAFDTLRVTHGWYDDFDNPAANYSHFAYLWMWRDEWSLTADPGAPARGTVWHCGGADGAAYDPHLDAVLMTPYVYNVTPGTSFAFDERHALEAWDATRAFDGARLELQVGTGAWQGVEPSPGYSHAMVGSHMPIPAGARCWSGRTNGWVTRTLDLSPFAPGPVRLRVRVCSDDFVGDDGFWLDRVRVTFADDPGVGVAPEPHALAAGAAWPNPTRGALHLPLALPRATRIEWTLLDVQGRRVASLWNGTMPAGRVTLDGALPEALAPGLYFSRVLADGRAIATRRVALAK